MALSGTYSQLLSHDALASLGASRLTEEASCTGKTSTIGMASTGQGLPIEYAHALQLVRVSRPHLFLNVLTATLPVCCAASDLIAQPFSEHQHTCIARLYMHPGLMFSDAKPGSKCSPQIFACKQSKHGNSSYNTDL